MDAAVHPLVPPAPQVHAHDLPRWRVLMEMGRSALEVWSQRCYEEPICRFGKRGDGALLLNDPQDVRHVLSVRTASYRRPVSALRIARPMTGDGVLLAEGADWRRQRRMLAPVFSNANVAVMLPHFQAASDVMLDQLRGVRVVNLARALHTSTLDAVLRALFSRTTQDGAASFAEMARRYGRGPGRPNPLDVFAKAEDDYAWSTAGRRRFLASRQRAVGHLVTERRSAGDQGANGDLLDLLLAARDPDSGVGLSDTEVGDQAATLLFAGFETTSRLLFWAAYLLARDPAEQARVRLELDGFPPSRVMGLDDLDRWPRLRQVLLETLRLYPPAPNIVREAIEPDRIGDQVVKPGTQVWISPWVMHRHHRHWENPTAFLPGRFEGLPAPWTSGPFIPFGAGPRICIGASFAMAQAQIMLANLVHGYRFALADERPVLPVATVTIAPAFEPDFSLDAV